MLINSKFNINNKFSPVSKLHAQFESSKRFFLSIKLFNNHMLCICMLENQRRSSHKLQTEESIGTELQTAEAFVHIFSIFTGLRKIRMPIKPWKYILSYRKSAKSKIQKVHLSNFSLATQPNFLSDFLS